MLRFVSIGGTCQVSDFLIGSFSSRAVTKAFKNQTDINSHVKMIENENKITTKDSRMKELDNWLQYINAN